MTNVINNIYRNMALMLPNRGANLINFITLQRRACIAFSTAVPVTLLKNPRLFCTLLPKHAAESDSSLILYCMGVLTYALDNA